MGNGTGAGPELEVTDAAAAKPTPTDPGSTPPERSAAVPEMQPAKSSKDVLEARKPSAPVGSSEEYFDSLIKPKPAPIPVPGRSRAPEDPTEALELPVSRRREEAAESQRDNGSALHEDMGRIQVKSAIRGDGEAWDPFLKDPEPEVRRFRWSEPVSDLERLKPGKFKRKRVHRLPAEERQQHQTLGQWLKEILLLGFIAVFTAVLLTNYVVQAFFIPSESMQDTLVTNDRVLVNKLVYNLRDPRPGDIVVFTSPERDAVAVPEAGPVGRALNQVAQGLGLRSSVQDLIKRVVAVEGQTVEVKIGSLYVDGKQVSEPYRKDRLPMPNYGPFQIPAGQVFVMGDNRMQSHDSRAFGPIDESTIVGRAFALIWPVQRFKWLS